MKKINIFILTLLGMLLVSLSSCVSSQTFTVQGIPGTVISSPNNERLAVIDNTGQAQIKTKRKDGYYHFLQAQTPGSNLQVPFALDYSNHSRGGKRGVCKGVVYTFGTICFAGLATMVVGALADVEDAFLYGGLIGIGSAGVCALIELGVNVDPIDEDYDYLKSQSTNSDIIR